MPQGRKPLTLAITAICECSNGSRPRGLAAINYRQYCDSCIFVVPTPDITVARVRRRLCCTTSLIVTVSVHGSVLPHEFKSKLNVWTSRCDSPCTAVIGVEVYRPGVILVPTVCLTWYSYRQPTSSIHGRPGTDAGTRSLIIHGMTRLDAENVAADVHLMYPTFEYDSCAVATRDGCMEILFPPVKRAIMEQAARNPFQAWLLLQ